MGTRHTIFFMGEEYPNIGGGSGSSGSGINDFELIGDIEFVKNSVTDIPLNNHLLTEYSEFYVEVSWVYNATEYTKTINVAALVYDTYYTVNDWYNASNVGTIFFRAWTTSRATIHTNINHITNNTKFYCRLYGRATT